MKDGEDLPVSIESDSGHHVWRGTGDNEVEKPLGGRSDSDVEGSKTSSRDLRDVDPANGTPAELEETGEEEDANESKVTSTRDISGTLWRIKAHVETDVEHGKTLGNRGPEKRAAATKGVSSEDQEGETGNHLDDTVDTGGEELDIVTLKTERSKDLGSVVVDGVGSGHLLADHESDRDKCALAVTRDGEHLLEEVLNGSTGDEHALVLKLVGNILQFSSNVLVGRRQVADTREDGSSLFPAILLGEETRGLLVQGHAAKEKDGGKSLKGKRNDVDSLAARDVHERTIVDPESQTGSSGNEQLV